MRKIALVCLLAFLILAACTPVNPTVTEPTGENPGTHSSQDPTDTSATETTGTNDNTQQQDPEISAELMALSDLFSTIENRFNPYHYIVDHEFDSPEQVKLIYLFPMGADGQQKPTDEEWAALKDKPGFNENYDFFRIPKVAANATLQKVLGITVDDLGPDGLWRLTYLEETDCYYFMSTGMLGNGYGSPVSMTVQPDGNIKFVYRIQYMSGQYAMVLKPVDGSYQIISNSKVEDQQVPELAYFNELFSQGEERNPYFYAKCIYGDYASPEELNLRSFYEGGFVGEHEITEEELAEYWKLLPPYIPELMGDFNRLPKDKINAELQTVFGISLEDLPDSAFSGLYYLECSDCYCFNQSGMTSDFQKSAFTDIVHNDDGTISLFYEDRYGKCAITLKPNGDSYLVLSNVHVE